MNTMIPRSLTLLIVVFSMLIPAASLAAVTPYPPYPGATPSLSYTLTVDGQPVFVHRFPTFNQFQWMDYASFSMTAKVRITITLLVSERDVVTCHVRPLAYDIKPQISGNTVSFDLDRPRYLVVFLNEEPRFQNTGLLLFAEPPEQNPPRLGGANVVNIMDYRVDNTGKTVETAKINQAISDVSSRPGGGVLFFPTGGIYKTGTLMMKSNVKLYVDAGAVIKGTRKSADYAAESGGGRRAQVLFENVENAGLMGRGAIDMDGYPWLWHDFQPDLGDGSARSAEGLVNDPRNGIRGYVVNNSRNITFEGLLLLRCAHWTVIVSNSENFTTRNIKIVNRKQQYHDDPYDITGNSRHILVEDGFAMSMDDTWAFYGGRGATGGGIEDVVVRGFVNYSYTSSVAIGYGSAPAIRNLRLEDVHFVANQNKFAIWIQITPAYFTGRGYSAGQRTSPNLPMDNFRFVNCTFEGDGGHIYIDGGDRALTNVVFENCTFYKADRPGKLLGKNVSPIVFKNVRMNGAVIRNVNQLKQAGYEVSVPVRFER
jgi:polygalacturonase